MARQLDGAGQRGNALRMVIWGFAVALFLLPLVAMQLTTEMQWDGFDFLVWGTMLLVACGTYELVSRMSPNRLYRLGAGVAIVTGFMTFWACGAVGMIGDEGNVYNALFLGAILVAAVLSLLAWFKPRGMARAMVVAAVIHIGAALYALVTGVDMLGSILSVVFGLPYLLAAALFARSAQQAEPTPAA
jgi:hypothetical protein